MPVRHQTARIPGCAVLSLCMAAATAACAPLSAVPANTATAASLQGSAWHLRVADGAPQPNLQFDRSGQVAGHTGCNAFRAPLAEQAGEIRIGPLASTKRLCIGSVHDTEKRFLSALEQTRGLAREGNHLYLLDRQGERLLQLDRAAESP